MTLSNPLLVVSWEQVYELLMNIANEIRKSGFKPEVIVGVSRGGWLPARVMSDLLENPELANVRTGMYLGLTKTKCKPRITQPVSISVDNKSVLLVDDITDTGESLLLVRSHLKEQGAIQVKTVTIHHKPWSLIVPDWFGRETSSWVIFPWERKEAIRDIMEQYGKLGKSVEKAKKRMLQSGLDSKLIERFIKEISEVSP